jgi:hypothetical protein
MNIDNEILKLWQSSDVLEQTKPSKLRSGGNEEQV